MHIGFRCRARLNRVTNGVHLSTTCLTLPRHPVGLPAALHAHVFQVYGDGAIIVTVGKEVYLLAGARIERASA